MSCDFHDREIAELELEWRTGDFRPLAMAFSLCVWRERILPNWMETPIMEALLIAANSGGPGRGGNLAKMAMGRTHQVRWNAMKLALLQGPARTAARRASDLLKGSPAWAQPRQIRDSFNIIENALKPR